jgi:hypothetical protein
MGFRPEHIRFRAARADGLGITVTNGKSLENIDVSRDVSSGRDIAP